MKKLAVILILSTFFACLGAQEISESPSSEAASETIETNPASESKEAALDQNLIVSKINFIGLKRTKNSHVQSKVRKFIGEPLSEIDMHDFETSVQLIGLFDDIHYSTEQISDTEAQINVSVKEKITFIPMPFIMYSTSIGFMAGGVVFDANAFGKQYMFMGGAFFSSTSKSGIVAFQKPSPRKGVPGISTFANFAMTTPKVVNAENDVVLRYEGITFGAGISLSEHFLDFFTFKNGYTFRHFGAEDHDDYKGQSPEGYNYGSISLAFEYSKPDWNGIFMSSSSASISAVFALTDSENSDYRFPMTFAATTGGEYPVFSPKFRLYRKFSASYGINNPIQSYGDRDAGAVTILPSNFITERIVGGNVGFEYALAKFSWGLISFYSDYQLVYAKDFKSVSEKGDYEFMHGPNGGLRVYLAKIAFPAVAAGLSYNVTKNYWQFAASVGMSF